MIIWAVLGTILVLYLFFVLIKEPFERRLDFNLCSICAAVSLTWISLLLFYLLGIFNDKLIIAILMGQSTVGIMYSFEKKFKKNKNLLALKVLIILLGTLITYYVLK